MKFDEFVRANMVALGKYCAVLTGDRHLAEDVLSDALITASARWDDIGQMKFPLAYVRRIVASTFVADRRRHHRRRNTTPHTDPAASVTSPGDPHGQLDDRDQLDRLLRTLTPTQRAAVVMRFYLDLPDTENRRSARLFAEQRPVHHFPSARCAAVSADRREGLIRDGAGRTPNRAGRAGTIHTGLTLSESVSGRRPSRSITAAQTAPCCAEACRSPPRSWRWLCSPLVSPSGTADHIRTMSPRHLPPFQRLSPARSGPPPVPNHRCPH